MKKINFIKPTIKKEELLNRIDELIIDKKSFLSNDQEANKIWLYDIETLEYARDIIQIYQFETLGYEENKKI